MNEPEEHFDFFSLSEKNKKSNEEIEQLQEVFGILSNALDYINKLIAVKTLNNKMKKETK